MSINEDRLTKQLGETIDERDAAENALSQAYYLITGRSPELSNKFGSAEIIEEILEEIADAQSVLRQTIATLTARAEAAEAENARMKEAVELATSQLELSTYTLAEAARREEAYSARLEAAEAREREAIGALEVASTPDMFWDAEDPESGGVDGYEVVERYSPGEIVRIQCAKSLPDVYGVYVTNPEDKGEWKYTFGTLKECEAAVAAASIVSGPKS